MVNYEYTKLETQENSHEADDSVKVVANYVLHCAPNVSALNIYTEEIITQ